MKHLIFLKDSVHRPDNEYVGRHIYPMLACHKLGVRIRHITRPLAPQPCRDSTQPADAGSQSGETLSAIALRQVMISVFCPGNKLTKFGRRVARLASFDRLRNQRLNAGDLRKVGERR